MREMDKRVERNKQSIFALCSYLQEVAQTPDKIVDEELIAALKSQGALAKYSNQMRNIVSSSINTMKRICAQYLDGGFDALDRLRVITLRTIEDSRNRNTSSNKITRKYMVQRIKELKLSNQKLKQELLLITQLLEISMRQARYYANQSMQDSLRILCEKEQQEIRAHLSLSNTCKAEFMND